MKSKAKLTSLVFALTLSSSIALAQEPSAAQPRAISSEPNESIVYLKKDYADSLDGRQLFLGNQLPGVRFQRFDNDFAVFTRKGSKNLIYIPKAVILYMEAEEKVVRY